MLNDPETIIRAELSNGEHLLWTGQPRQGIVFRSIDTLLIPFSLMWGGFAIFWEGTVIAAGAPPFFALWGVPFVLVGLYLIFGRFFYDAWQRSKMFYGVTAERVIIVSGITSRQVKSLSLDTLHDVSFTERSSGGGTITFGPTTMMMWWGNPGAGWPAWGPTVPGFELAGGAREVYETIRGAQRARRTPQPRETHDG